MDRKALLDDIKLIMPGVAKKDIIELFTCLNFFGDKAVATDGRLFIRVKFGEDTGVNLAVPGKPLYAILNSLTTPNIVLEVVKGRLCVREESIEAKLLVPEIEPGKRMDKIIDEPADDQWKEASSAFIRALRLCRFSCSGDQTLGALTGVHVAGKVAYSCDRFRISKHEVEELDGCEGITISATVIDELVKHEGHVQKFCVVGDIVYFSLYDGKLLIASPRIQGDFPKVGKFFEGSEELGSMALPDTLPAALKRQCIVLENSLDVDKATNIHVEKDKLVLVSSSKEIGEVRETVAAEAPNQLVSAKLLINPLFLVEILEMTSGMSYFPAQQAVVFRGGGLTHLVKLRKS